MTGQFYGTEKSLEIAPDAYLEKMLHEIGRNGETTHSQEMRSKIEAILRARREAGVCCESNGIL